MSLADLIPDLDRRLAERIEASVRGFESAVLDHLREQHERTRETLAALRPALGSTLAAADLEPLRASAAAGAREQAFAALLAAARAVDAGDDQVEVLCRLLEQSAPFCSRAALVVLDGSGARGWAAVGFGEGIRAIDGVALGWDDPAWAAVGGGTGVVRLVDAGRSLCRQAGVEEAQVAMAIPVVLQGRVAAVLYVDGQDGSVELEPLQLLAQVASGRIENLGVRGASPTLRTADGSPGLPIGLLAAAAAPVAAAVEVPAAPMPLVSHVEPQPMPAVEEVIEEAATPEPIFEPEPAAAPELDLAPPAVAAEPAEDLWAPESDAVEAVPTAVEAVERSADEELFIAPEPEPVAAAAAEDLWAPEPLAPAATADAPDAEAAEVEVEQVSAAAEVVYSDEVFEAVAEPEAAEVEVAATVDDDIFAPDAAAPLVDVEEVSAELPELPPVAAEEVPPAEVESVAAAPEVAPAPFESVDATVAVSQSLLKQYAMSQGAGAITGQIDVPVPSPPAPVETPAIDAEDETVLLRRPTPPAAGPEDETNPTMAKPSAEVKLQGGMVVPPSDLAGPGWAFRAGRSAEPSADPALEEARRLARLLVSEIKLYNEEQVEEGRRKRDLYARLRDDIDRSREVYESRVNPKALEHDFFREALVRVLAGGDPNVLGA